jgi:hypothetical protein
VLAEKPQISRARDRLLGRILFARVVDVGGLELLPERFEQVIDVDLVETGAEQRVLRAQLLQEIREVGLREARHVAQAVVGYGVRGRFQALEVGLDDLDLGPSKGLRRGVGAVPGADHPPSVDDDGLLHPEACEGALESLQAALVVQAHVGGIQVDRVDRDPFDGQFVRVFQAEQPLGRARLWLAPLGVTAWN